MNDRRTIMIFAVVFVLLFATVVWQGVQLTRQPNPTGTNAPQQTQPANNSGLGELPLVFPDMATIAIQRIEFTNPDQTQSFTLTRDQNTWVLNTEDGGIPADEEGRALAQTISILPYQEIVETDSETDLSQFGFVVSNPDAFIMSIRTINGQTHRVIVGGLDQAETGFYAIVDDRPGFYLLDARAIAFVQSNLRNLSTRLTIK